MKEAADFKPGDEVKMLVGKHYNHSHLCLNRKVQVVRVTGSGKVIIRLGNGQRVSAYANDLERA
jgi:predicted Zn-dependent protease